jgi:hypothetical protein
MGAARPRLRGIQNGLWRLPDAAVRSALVRRISHAIGYVKFRSRSHHAVIRVYDAAGNVIGNAQARGRVQGGLTITFEILIVLVNVHMNR